MARVVNPCKCGGVSATPEKIQELDGVVLLDFCIQDLFV
jgi:hypothetical protein